MCLAMLGPEQPNYLRFRVSPDIAIALGAHAKKAGPTMQGREVELFVSQQQAEKDAYERLISEALIGDTSHFARQDEVEAAWAIVDPALGVDGAVRVHAGDLGSGRGGPAHQGPMQLAQSRQRRAQWTRACAPLE